MSPRKSAQQGPADEDNESTGGSGLEEEERFLEDEEENVVLDDVESLDQDTIPVRKIDIDNKVRCCVSEVAIS
jgi:hypothetical protein